MTQVVNWPKKHNVLGVGISATTYDQTVDCLIAAAKRRQSAIADFVPVHGLMVAARDPQYNAMVRTFDIVAPDGQPVRWALNRFHNAGLRDRVYGPELTRRMCEAAANEGLSIYLYGSTDETLDKLRANLLRMFPTLRIAGFESPPFRPLTDEEHDQAVERINRSGASIVLIGIGCPRQAVFAHRIRHQISAVQLCVGAAFDFHAGSVSMAPPWMQKRGLEWLYRLVKEPRRLWKRYLVTNTLFVQQIVIEWSRRKFAGEQLNVEA
jgi:exopolysaccharide biosynthesis WecB/TagA/CpsF family protein